MNPYFLLTYMMTFFLSGLDLTSFIRTAMSMVKYIRLFLSMLMPEPKGTLEMKRGFVKISYFADQGDGMKKYHLLLPTSGKPKTWSKVEAVTRDDYLQSLVDNLTVTVEGPKADLTFQPIDPVPETTKIVDVVLPAPVGESQQPDDSMAVPTDMTAEIDEYLASHPPPKETKEEPKEKKGASKYKHCPKIDVTEAIVDLAGPGRDFFKVQLTPADLSSTYKALIFHYGMRTKTFEAEETIVFL